LGGSLNAGSGHAMAQAAHGSAPDIAGRNIANPDSLILSAALLLAWQGQREGKGEFEEAARAIEAAVEAAIAAREVTADIGGRLGTHEAATALANILADPGREAARSQRA